MIAGAAWNETQARSPRKEAPKRVIHGPNYRPPYAAIVVDDKSGFVLHEVSVDEPRHPASLTKIMTLYLLFEQLEDGRLNLDTPLPVSSRAAMQNPTKLGLKANQTIKVEDAIKGLVTRSANDAAVVIAEAIGGSEEEFAKLMTLKARALGMTSTTYINASGLPADEQITTARDQAVLGRAIQHRFPGYYQYFATPSFHYKGAEIHNHNALLGQVKGVDGIKTGYTEASGYNLVTSVRRDEKHIVAVVLGGTSNAARDARMRQLIEEYISLASTPAHGAGHRGQPRRAHGGWGMVALSRRAEARGCPLALPVALAHRPLLRPARLEEHRRGNPSGRRRQQPTLHQLVRGRPRQRAVLSSLKAPICASSSRLLVRRRATKLDEIIDKATLHRPFLQIRTASDECADVSGKLLARQPVACKTP